MKNVKKILIISDTHGDEKKYREIIEKVSPDLTLHAGDYSDSKSRKTFDKKKFAKYVDYFVEGNHGVKNKYHNKIKKFEETSNDEDEFIVSKHRLYFKHLKKDWKIININGERFLLTHIYEPAYDDMWVTWMFLEYQKMINELVRKKRVNHIVYGHTHTAKISKNKNVNLINPGSLTKPENQKNGSYIVGYYKNNKFKFKKYYLTN